ncbi:tripartite tricarboxylate transporter substrate binding protein [Bradyrhizobium sp. NBAIM20]|uniref:Bug family tripartite tricarboxylate transporter substrate binding protein n=1 Tax=unclassified Bradyrhizobium TaxID=2631580 RepID=UPI001CD32ED0|nr:MULTISPECIES: tripartite tricarboxylate transporter substrate binding protein [unclassified Bradyrhizobium]MCA1410865.1 tripartite tricarboxylate transporter substrate binding protein [Bradyrhizobium sp. NBAIM20]MCA1461691.1 tripartite tricarboxylate transporter substrate binding protein [Bradyrhizobium sp. NBAIM18]
MASHARLLPAQTIAALRIVASSLLILSAATSARAEDVAAYPTRKIRMLLPYAAGGGGDVVGRLLADRMGKTLGQSIYVENHTGAAGTIGTQMVATSANDGYTITVGGMTTHVLAPAIYPKLPYDPIKDFTTIGRVGVSSIMLVATKDFAAHDIKGLVALAKKGEPIQYGSWGVGSTGQFCAEILMQQTGIRMDHVPFNGIAKLAGDLLGRHISLATLDVATATPLVKEGSIKALAACGERSPSLPEIASYKEQGVAFDRSLSWAMYAPAGVAPPIAQKLSAALKEALGDDVVKQKLLALGITPQFVAGEEQRDINARDITAWKQVAKDAGIEVK